MNAHGICPGCGRHCDLSDPHCGRGVSCLQAPAEGRPPSPGEHSENDRLIDALRDLSRIMRAQYEGRASQKRILMILRETGKITQRDLTERLGIQPGSASEILAKLENTELIVRTPNEEDRRTADVQLTEGGRALAEEAAGQRRERHEKMFACLSEEERQTLLSLLEKLRTDWAGQYQNLPCPEGRHEQFERRGQHERHSRRGAHGRRERG